MTSRRAFNTRPFASPAARPRLATVIRRSTNGRSSFAFGTVVVRCSYLSRAVAWFRSMEMRCSVTRPNLRCATRCLITFSLAGGAGWAGPAGWNVPSRLSCPSCLSCLLLRCSRRLVDTHAEAEAHRRQDFLDLVQALAPEVLRLEHLGFRL